MQHMFFWSPFIIAKAFHILISQFQVSNREDWPHECPNLKTDGFNPPQKRTNLETKLLKVRHLPRAKIFCLGLPNSILKLAFLNVGGRPFNGVEWSAPHSCLHMIRFYSQAWHQQRGKRVTPLQIVHRLKNLQIGTGIGKSLPIRKFAFHIMVSVNLLAFHLSWSSLGDWSNGGLRAADEFQNLILTPSELFVCFFLEPAIMTSSNDVRNVGHRSAYICRAS